MDIFFVRSLMHLRYAFVMPTLSFRYAFVIPPLFLRYDFASLTEADRVHYGGRSSSLQRMNERRTKDERRNMMRIRGEMLRQQQTLLLYKTMTNDVAYVKSAFSQKSSYQGMMRSFQGMIWSFHGMIRSYQGMQHIFISRS